MKRGIAAAAGVKTPSAPAYAICSVGPVNWVLLPATRLMALLCASTYRNVPA